MKTRLFIRFPSMALAGLLILTVVGILGFGPEAKAEGRGKFEGTWINDVKIVTCPPAPHIEIAALQTMTTYMRGGTLIEGSGPATPPPAISRGAGHGIWERTGGHALRTFFRSHFFDNLGRLVRIVEVSSSQDLMRGDNPDTVDIIEPYYLSGDGTSKITNLNPVDGSVIDVTEGCNEAISRPMLFED